MSTRTKVSRTDSRLPLGLVVLLSVAAGLAAGNLYWVQPLFALVGEEFGMSASDASYAFAIAQAAYALGVLLLVPLGDMMDRRKLVCALMAASAAALALSAFAPAFALLAASLALVGFTSLAGQLIVPLAGDLAGDAERGHVLGIVAGGIMCGILLSRTASGIVAGAFGWRAVFAVSAVANIVLAPVLLRRIPPLPKRSELAYPQLLTRVVLNVVRIPVMARILVLNGILFCAFNMFWTAVTLLLSAPPFNYSVFQIGLVSLAGLTGALASMAVGRFPDRGQGVAALGVALCTLFVARIVAIFAAESLAVLIVAAAFGALSLQAGGVINQAHLFELAPDMRSCLNTSFVVSNFVWGAAGSAMASFLWGVGQWLAVALAGCTLSTAALAVWLASRRSFGSIERKR